MNMHGIGTATPGTTCAFNILGPMAVRINGEDCTPSASKIRQVLGLMLMQPNRVMALDSAIEELWYDRPPRTAVTVVQTYVYQLRKLLAGYGDGQMIRTVAPGYVLAIPLEDVDYWRFTGYVEQGRDALERDMPRQASALLTAALDLWNGSALENIEHGPVLRNCADRLEEQRMLALELRLRANMSLGHFRELIPELKSLVAAYPYHEWLYGQLMVALHRCGRRGEALAAYQEVRRMLSVELGLEPSAALQAIQQSVLNADIASLQHQGAG